MFGFRRSRSRVRLALEPHAEGYVFVQSPDLPGFTFVLGPGEDQNIRTLTDAMFGPLTAFLAAQRETERARPAEPVEVTGIRRTGSRKYVAELCTA